MGTLVPTPVTVEDLIDETSAINIVDAAAAQAVSPRTQGVQTVTVQTTDDPNAPTLASGTADADVLNSLSDSTALFETGTIVTVGDTVINTETGVSALVTVVVSETVLTLGTTDAFIDGTDAYRIVAAADLGYYTQKNLGGEWVRSNARTGNDEGAAYFLPVTAAAVVVHSVIYPIALAAIGTYPPISA